MITYFAAFFLKIISVFNIVVHLLVRCCSIDNLVFYLVLNAWRDLFSGNLRLNLDHFKWGNDS